MAWSAHQGDDAFLRHLVREQRSYLWAQAAHAVCQPPGALTRWHGGEEPLGWLEPARAAWLMHHLDGCHASPLGPVWAMPERSHQRSEVLQHMLMQARVQGLLSGWREERMAFWDPVCVAPDPRRPALFEIERAGFRFLGLRSQAVHVNGFTPDGRLWVARRAQTKATDPGLLDNLAAGGIPLGETVLQCMLRELAEEAAVPPECESALRSAGTVVTQRLEPQGWHDEVLHVFNLSVPDDFVPNNRDGEVSDFASLPAAEVLDGVEQQAFTADAVQALIQGLAARSLPVRRNYF